MKLCFSIALVTPLPQVGQNGTSFETPFGNFGRPLSLDFHNCMEGLPLNSISYHLVKDSIAS